MPHANPSLEIVCHTVPERLNEDAWLAQTAGTLSERIMIAAIDGATTRLTPPPLQAYLDSLSAPLPSPLTPAALAARIVRAALTRHISGDDSLDPRALMLAANADLGDTVRGVLGDLTLDAMEFPLDIAASLEHDPRLVRLGLPVCVVTLAEYDPAGHTLRYAHAGDTALLVAYTDGRASVPTAPPPDFKFDDPLITLIENLRAQKPTLTTRELTQHPDVRHFNLHSALRHNYVDEHGLPQPSQGTGVLNGQSELRYFVKTGEIDMTDVAFVCVLTDGLEWPASAAEIQATGAATAAALTVERYAYMAEQIAARGLAGYLAHLRATEAADANHNQYPRMKTHDDAAGVLLRFD